jgi:hypothetical protein
MQGTAGSGGATTGNAAAGTPARPVGTAEGQGGSGGSEPAQTATRAKELNAGIAPPASQAQQQTTDVEGKVNQLIHQSQAGIQSIPPNLLPQKPATN